MSGSPFGILESKAAEEATGAQTKATELAAATQLQMYNQSRADTAPWRAAGEGALNALWGTPGTPGTPGGQPIYGNALVQPSQEWGIIGYQGGEPGAFGTTTGGTPIYGPINTSTSTPQITGYTQPTAGTPGTQGLIQRGPGEFKESPSYQFALQQGLQAQQRAASATGRLGSGAYLKDATTYAKNLASEEYQNFLNRYYQSLDPYFRLSGYGSNVAMSGQNTSTQTGNALANTYMQGGQAQAAGILGQYNSIANSMGNTGNQVGNWLVQNKPWAQNTGWQAGGGLGTVGAAGTVAGTGLTAAEMNAMMWL